MTAPTSPGTAARKRSSASKTDDPDVVFHKKQRQKAEPDQSVIANRIGRRIAVYSAASRKMWRTRKRMAEARSRAEYEAAAEEHQARLLAAEAGDKGK